MLISARKDTNHLPKKWVYSEVFNNEFNIGFFLPKKDLCSKCATFENCTMEEEISMKEEHTKHIERKETCRAMKKSDKEKAEKQSDTVCSVFD